MTSGEVLEALSAHADELVAAGVQGPDVAAACLAIAADFLMDAPAEARDHLVTGFLGLWGIRLVPAAGLRVTNNG